MMADLYPPQGVYLTGNRNQTLWFYRTPIYKARLPVPEEKAKLVSPEVNILDAVPSFELLTPKIPLALLEVTIGIFRWVLEFSCRQMEAAVYLCFRDGEWSCKVPDQKINSCSVEPEPISAKDGVGMIIHSHGYLPAFFSGTDDAGEDDGFIYGVIGNLKSLSPTFKFRVGDRGYFLPVPFDALWDYERKEG